MKVQWFIYLIFICFFNRGFNQVNEVIEFEQMNVNLDELNTSTIKQPKLQETSTIKLLNCFVTNTFLNRIC